MKLRIVSLAVVMSACGGIATAPGLPGDDAGAWKDAASGEDAGIRDATVDTELTYDASGRACTTSSECGGESICAFPVADRCAATGICMYFPPCPEGSACGPLPEPGCGCDGKPVDFVGGGAYAKAPVRSPDACSLHTPETCTTEKTCGNDELCVNGICTQQCMDSDQCWNGGICDFSQCYGPHGCNPPPPGQGCPPVCQGVCLEVDVGDDVGDDSPSGH